MRTNIDINDDLLKEAMKISKAATKKDVVNEALQEYIKMHKRKILISLRGKVKWEGDLNAMRTYEKG